MRWLPLLLIPGMVLCGASLSAEQENPSSPSKGVELTAEDQGNSPQDRELTSKIREALVGNDRLSVEAKNIKIISRDGKVTLRGHVLAVERAIIVSTAADVAGADHVHDALEITSP